MDPNQGVDLNDRPGVPMEWDVPKLMLDLTTEDHQEPHAEILHEPTRENLTTVFGTGSAPRGLSGVVRRIAYKLPDYRVKRWLLLLIADRIDATEQRVLRLVGATHKATA